LRYINTTKIKLPEGWEEKAEKLKNKLSEIDDPNERTKFINDHRIWTELREALEELSGGKCWYSEAKELVSLYDVDHFRPKGNVLNMNGTCCNIGGYWWLAFDWENYRLSGQICNRPLRDTDYEETKGKHNYFPLRKGSAISTEPHHDLRDEINYLLDPTDPDDPNFISFDEFGNIIPAVEPGSWEAERVKITVKLLHLDYEKLKEERKKVWDHCTRRINEAQNIMLKEIESSSASLKTDLKKVLTELREMIHPHTELSSIARTCLLRSNVTWAQKLVAN